MVQNMSSKKYTDSKFLFKNKSGELTEKNFHLFAARSYINPRVLDVTEFEEDLVRFKYLRRLFNRYKEDQESLQERLILNHLTIIHNVFEMEAANEMCFHKIDVSQWSTLKTFMIYLNLIPLNYLPNISIDPFAVKRLQAI
jgi:hypothetical protein